jgi:hypothetical protein
MLARLWVLSVVGLLEGKRANRVTCVTAPSRHAEAAMGIFRTLTNLLVRGRAQSKPATLGEVLADSTNLHFFAQYAAAAGRCDLLIMWIECQQYASANARLLRRHKARGLVRAYFGEGGVLDEMGLSDVRVEIITTHCLSAAELSPALFEPLQRALERELQHDVLPGFLASELNRRMVAAEGDFSAVLSIDDFDLLSFLGAGGFGMVLLARRKQTGRLYALKLLDKRTLLSRKHVFSVFREKAALAHVSHPFIVSLKFALESEDLLGFVCDYAPGGNLYASVSDLGPCPLERARVYAAQMVLALSQVHDMGILYRDLKPDNVLIDTDGHCRLADMGAARGEQAGGEIGAGGSYRNKTLRKSELCESAADSDLERALAEVGAASLDDETADADSASSHPRKGVSTRMTISGTHGYRAPEVYARAYGKGVDWWDLGLLLLEMLTGSNPYRGHTRADSEYLAKHEQVETPAWFDAQARLHRGGRRRDPRAPVLREHRLGRAHRHRRATRRRAERPRG